MTLVVCFSFVLIFVTILIHFVVLQQTSRVLVRCGSPRPMLSVVAVFGAVVAHLVEIGLYASAYYTLTVFLPVGEVEGVPITNPMDYFYYSTVMYTSLGLGDAYPASHLRFISSIEALNGLLLIGWSTSFTFLAMRTYWSLGPLPKTTAHAHPQSTPNIKYR